jgi:hypothetical protein
MAPRLAHTWVATVAGGDPISSSAPRVGEVHGRRVDGGQTEAVTSPRERCDGCGFDGAVFDDADLLVALRSLGDRWRRQLAGAGRELRLRPEPDTWSAIEYAAP